MESLAMRSPAIFVCITLKSAWFLLHRIRLALEDEFFGSKLGDGSGEVEVEETFIGGKARNMHKSVRHVVSAAGKAHGR